MSLVKKVKCKTTFKLTFVVPKAEDVQIVYTSMLPRQQLTFWFGTIP